MKLFIDTGSVAEVEEIAAWGVLSGATTNPTLLAKEEDDPGDAIRRICELVDGPVSGEVVSDTAREMVAEGRALAGLDDRVVVKVPFSAEGLAATRELASDIPLPTTLVFLGGAGPADGRGGCHLRLLLHGPARRHLGELRGGAGGDRRGARPGPRGTGTCGVAAEPDACAVTAARLGCEVATAPAKVLKAMLAHPLTEAERREVRGRLEEPARVRRVAPRPWWMRATAKR